jgi:5'-nucleotidase / UDP-sugar diphosphatase
MPEFIAKYHPMDKTDLISKTGRIFLISAIFCLLFSALSTSQSIKFTLLHTSDEHSVLLPLPMVDYEPDSKDSTLGGFARLATLVNRIRDERKDQAVLLFSSGDNIGGTPFSWLIPEGYSPEIEIMKLTGYDALTIGNHEFDYGPDMLADYLLRAGYPGLGRELPLLGSNLMIPEGHRLLETGIRENVMFELQNGITLGVFGIMGRGAYDVATSASPVEITDPFTTAARQVERLRDAGADIVVAITHSGIEEDRDLASRVGGVDIILGGHDHIIYEPEIINKTFVIHSGSYLEYLGNYEFEWNIETGDLTLVNNPVLSPFLIPLDSRIAEDPGIREVAMEYLAILNQYVSGHTQAMFTDVRTPLMWSDFRLEAPSPFTETTVGNFVTDAMRLIGSEITGEKVDIAFQGNGVIRGDIIPGTMEWSEGKISFFDLVTISGLGSGADGKAGYPMVSLYLTGREVVNVLEISALLAELMGDIYFLQVSGLRYSLAPGRAMWLRVPFGGPPIPAYRAVSGIELYAGEGIQDDDNYIPLENDEGRLYHVVTDYYLTSFLPMVGERLPRLKVQPKDKYGHPVEPDQALVTYRQGEFKVWEAVVRYAVSLETDDEIGLPVIPVHYRVPGNRIFILETMPLRYWSYLTILIIAGLLIYMVYLIAAKVTRRR